MDWSMTFLGAIALATLVMAVVQVGVIVYSMRMASRVSRLVDRVERDLAPALGRMNDVSGDIHRATSLAAAQLERADALFARISQRVDHVTAAAHDVVVEPARRGAAVWHGVRKAADVFRDGERRDVESSEAS